VADAFATINGYRLVSLHVDVANRGPWVATCVLDEEAPGVAGASMVTIAVGKTSLRGTVIPQYSGSHALQRRCMVAGGGAGWGSELDPKHYHNDAGVKARLVAEDLARESGETLGGFTPARERVGRDFVRARGSSSRTLEQTIGDSVTWWVDYGGITHVGTRPAAPPPGKYQLMAYDPRERVATLAVEDPADITIGSTLTERMEAPQVVRELEIVVKEDEFRVHAWCGGDDADAGRLVGAIERIARRAVDQRLLGKHRYRVVSMAGDGRVELQAVKRAGSLPDAKLVPQWPGVAGVHAELAPGAEVLIEFIDGDPTEPIITGYAGKDGVGFVPASLVLGGPDGLPAARQNDVVEVLLPPATITGTAIMPSGPTPITGVLQFLVPKALGVITGGSQKVKVAT
jgi:hypothetical protein